MPGTPQRSRPSRLDVTEHARRWAAVVVNYESGDLLAACVRSLLADDGFDEPAVVVVDNGSTDGSVARMRRDLQSARAASVTVVEPGANLGYAGGVNRGVASTRAPVVMVCNPDVEVVAGTAAAMVQRLEREPDLAAVGPAMRNPDGSLYPSARADPSPLDAVGHAVLGSIAPRNRFTRRYRQLDVDPSRAARRGVGVGRGHVAAALRGGVGRRLGRALLHVPRGRRRVLAASPARLACRLRPGR